MLDSPLESPGSQLSVNVNVALLLIKMVPHETKKVAPKPQEGESASLEPSPATSDLRNAAASDASAFLEVLPAPTATNPSESLLRMG